MQLAACVEEVTQILRFHKSDASESAFQILQRPLFFNTNCTQPSTRLPISAKLFGMLLSSGNFRKGGDLNQLAMDVATTTVGAENFRSRPRHTNALQDGNSVQARKKRSRSRGFSASTTAHESSEAKDLNEASVSLELKCNPANITSEVVVQKVSPLL